ncbi:2Fe-2S iron-sulfur cluster-binding protein (plasmid) [Rhizobium sp. CB3171]|uniref:2Fe-2S iron-sulfur cluster-binding protein n=1 Tax=Rhizobium sp. CB3171 TaxID=3039157 RepID=UPI0024B28210|nr:2Fe-2S iron-sulfur cluster-binding protein [Rhizobium sp. CB3171]WFU05774.1 2Fe-2S iron-sulfur cluster-binding protein [Rhizobium sp. CB3171]
MLKLTIIAFDGARFELEAEPGSTVMENAIRNSVAGVVAECGGACACATCHVYIDGEWVERVGPANSIEAEMLNFALDVKPASRLSCQLTLSKNLDGLIVSVPARQT